MPSILCPAERHRAFAEQVVSAKNTKTIIVAYDSFSEHPLYRKRVRKTSRIVAHDEDGKAGPGDYVRIIPCAPVSKSKRFRLDAIIKKFGFLVDEVGPHSCNRLDFDVLLSNMCSTPSITLSPC